MNNLNTSINLAKSFVESELKADGSEFSLDELDTIEKELRIAQSLVQIARSRQIPSGKEVQ